MTGMAEGLADHMARQGDRDVETIARIAGPEAVAAERGRRAVMLLGTDSQDVAEYRAIMLRRKARTEPERFTADDAEALAAAEIVHGVRTDLGRKVLAEAHASGWRFPDLLLPDDEAPTHERLDNDLRPR